MLDGCVRVLAQWGWDERPVAVVAMPSRRRPLLVDSLARGHRRRSAGCPTRVRSRCATAARPASPAATARSASRASGSGSTPRRLDLPPGPVLLVDDLVDSRWTVTVAARELRRAGASAVLPFALALRG